MLKYRNHSCSVDEFARKYLKYEQLVRDASDTSRYRRLVAYRSLAARLHTDVWTVFSFEKLFRKHYYHKIHSLVQRGVRNYDQLPSKPSWLKPVEQKLKLIPRVRPQKHVPAPPSPDEVLDALSAKTLKCANLNAPSAYIDIKDNVIPTASVEDLHEIWFIAQKLSMQFLKLSARSGDTHTIAPSILRVADAVLLYAVKEIQLISNESEQMYLESEALSFLWYLVQRHEVEHPQKRERIRRWLLVGAEYCATGRQVSIIVLQRRWYELKLRAREKILVCWRIACQNFQNYDYKRPKDIELPIRIYLEIVKKYPSVVLKPFPSWRVLVDTRYIVTEENINDFRHVGSTATSQGSNSGYYIEEIRPHHALNFKLQSLTSRLEKTKDKATIKKTPSNSTHDRINKEPEKPASKRTVYLDGKQTEIKKMDYQDATHAIKVKINLEIIDDRTEYETIPRDSLITQQEFCSIKFDPKILTEPKIVLTSVHHNPSWIKYSNSNRYIKIKHFTPSIREREMEDAKWNKDNSLDDTSPFHLNTKRKKINMSVSEYNVSEIKPIRGGDDDQQNEREENKTGAKLPKLVDYNSSDESDADFSSDSIGWAIFQSLTTKEQKIPKTEHLAALLDVLLEATAANPLTYENIQYCCPARKYWDMSDARQRLATMAEHNRVHPRSDCNCCCQDLVTGFSANQLKGSLAVLHELITRTTRKKRDRSPVTNHDRNQEMPRKQPQRKRAPQAYKISNAARVVHKYKPSSPIYDIEIDSFRDKLVRVNSLDYLLPDTETNNNKSAKPNLNIIKETELDLTKTDSDGFKMKAVNDQKIINKLFSDVQADWDKIIDLTGEEEENITETDQDKEITNIKQIQPINSKPKEYHKNESDILKLKRGMEGKVLRLWQMLQPGMECNYNINDLSMPESNSPEKPIKPSLPSTSTMSANKLLNTYNPPDKKTIDQSTNPLTNKMSNKALEYELISLVEKINQDMAKYFENVKANSKPIKEETDPSNKFIVQNNQKAVNAQNSTPVLLKNQINNNMSISPLVSNQIKKPVVPKQITSFKTVGNLLNSRDTLIACIKNTINKTSETSLNAIKTEKESKMVAKSQRETKKSTDNTLRPAPASFLSNNKILKADIQITPQQTAKLQSNNLLKISNDAMDIESSKMLANMENAKSSTKSIEAGVYSKKPFSQKNAGSMKEKVTNDFLIKKNINIDTKLQPASNEIVKPVISQHNQKPVSKADSNLLNIRAPTKTSFEYLYNKTYKSDLNAIEAKEEEIKKVTPSNDNTPTPTSESLVTFTQPAYLPDFDNLQKQKEMESINIMIDETAEELANNISKKNLPKDKTAIDAESSKKAESANPTITPIENGESLNKPYLQNNDELVEEKPLSDFIIKNQIYNSINKSQPPSTSASIEIVKPVISKQNQKSASKVDNNLLNVCEPIRSSIKNETDLNSKKNKENEFKIATLNYDETKNASGNKPPPATKSLITFTQPAHTFKNEVPESDTQKHTENKAITDDKPKNLSKILSEDVIDEKLPKEKIKQEIVANMETVKSGTKSIEKDVPSNKLFIQKDEEAINEKGPSTRASKKQTNNKMSTLQPTSKDKLVSHIPVSIKIQSSKWLEIIKQKKAAIEDNLKSSTEPIDRNMSASNKLLIKNKKEDFMIGNDPEIPKDSNISLLQQEPENKLGVNAPESKECQRPCVSSLEPVNILLNLCESMKTGIEKPKIKANLPTQAVTESKLDESKILALNHDDKNKSTKKTSAMIEVSYTRHTSQTSKPKKDMDKQSNKRSDNIINKVAHPKKAKNLASGLLKKYQCNENKEKSIASHKIKENAPIKGVIITSNEKQYQKKKDKTIKEKKGTISVLETDTNKNASISHSTANHKLAPTCFESNVLHTSPMSLRSSSIKHKSPIIPKTKAVSTKKKIKEIKKPEYEIVNQRCGESLKLKLTAKTPKPIPIPVKTDTQSVSNNERSQFNKLQKPKEDDIITSVVKCSNKKEKNFPQKTIKEDVLNSKRKIKQDIKANTKSYKSKIELFKEDKPSDNTSPKKNREKKQKTFEKPISSKCSSQPGSQEIPPVSKTKIPSNENGLKKTQKTSTKSVHNVLKSCVPQLNNTVKPKLKTKITDNNVVKKKKNNIQIISKNKIKSLDKIPKLVITPVDVEEMKKLANNFENFQILNNTNIQTHDATVNYQNDSFSKKNLSQEWRTKQKILDCKQMSEQEMAPANKNFKSITKPFGVKEDLLKQKLETLKEQEKIRESQPTTKNIPNSPMSVPRLFFNPTNITSNPAHNDLKMSTKLNTKDETSVTTVLYETRSIEKVFTIASQVNDMTQNVADTEAKSVSISITSTHSPLILNYLLPYNLLQKQENESYANMIQTDKITKDEPDIFSKDSPLKNAGEFRDVENSKEEKSGTKTKVISYAGKFKHHQNIKEIVTSKNYPIEETREEIKLNFLQQFQLQAVESVTEGKVMSPLDTLFHQNKKKETTEVKKSTSLILKEQNNNEIYLSQATSKVWPKSPVPVSYLLQKPVEILNLPAETEQDINTESTEEGQTAIIQAPRENKEDFSLENTVLKNIMIKNACEENSASVKTKLRHHVPRILPKNGHKYELKRNKNNDNSINCNHDHNYLQESFISSLGDVKCSCDPVISSIQIIDQGELSDGDKTRFDENNVVLNESVKDEPTNITVIKNDIVFRQNKVLLRNDIITEKGQCNAPSYMSTSPPKALTENNIHQEKAHKNDNPTLLIPYTPLKSTDENTSVTDMDENPTQSIKTILQLLIDTETKSTANEDQPVILTRTQNSDQAEQCTMELSAMPELICNDFLKPVRQSELYTSQLTYENISVADIDDDQTQFFQNSFQPVIDTETKSTANEDWLVISTSTQNGDKAEQCKFETSAVSELYSNDFLKPVNQAILNVLPTAPLELQKALLMSETHNETLENRELFPNAVWVFDESNKTEAQISEGNNEPLIIFSFPEFENNLCHTKENNLTEVNDELFIQISDGIRKTPMYRMPSSSSGKNPIINVPETKCKELETQSMRQSKIQKSPSEYSKNSRMTDDNQNDSEQTTSSSKICFSKQKILLEMIHDKSSPDDIIGAITSEHVTQKTTSQAITKDNIELNDTNQLSFIEHNKSSSVILKSTLEQITDDNRDAGIVVDLQKHNTMIIDDDSLDIDVNNTQESFNMRRKSLCIAKDNSNIDDIVMIDDDSNPDQSQKQTSLSEAEREKSNKLYKDDIIIVDDESIGLDMFSASEPQSCLPINNNIDDRNDDVIILEDINEAVVLSQKSLSFDNASGNQPTTNECRSHHVMKGKKEYSLIENMGNLCFNESDKNEQHTFIVVDNNSLDDKNVNVFEQSSRDVTRTEKCFDNASNLKCQPKKRMSLLQDMKRNTEKKKALQEVTIIINENNTNRQQSFLAEVNKNVGVNVCEKSNPSITLTEKSLSTDKLSGDEQATSLDNIQKSLTETLNMKRITLKEYIQYNIDDIVIVQKSEHGDNNFILNVPDNTNFTVPLTKECLSSDTLTGKDQTTSTECCSQRQNSLCFSEDNNTENHNVSKILHGTADLPQKPLLFDNSNSNNEQTNTKPENHDERLPEIEGKKTNSLIVNVDNDRTEINGEQSCLLKDNNKFDVTNTTNYENPNPLVTVIQQSLSYNTPSGNGKTVTNSENMEGTITNNENCEMKTKMTQIDKLSNNKDGDVIVNNMNAELSCSVAKNNKVDEINKYIPKESFGPTALALESSSFNSPNYNEHSIINSEGDYEKHILMSLIEMIRKKTKSSCLDDELTFSIDEICKIVKIKRNSTQVDMLAEMHKTLNSEDNNYDASQQLQGTVSPIQTSSSVDNLNDNGHSTTIQSHLIKKKPVLKMKQKRKRFLYRRDRRNNINTVLKKMDHANMNLYITNGNLEIPSSIEENNNNIDGRDKSHNANDNLQIVSKSRNNRIRRKAQPKKERKKIKLENKIIKVCKRFFKKQKMIHIDGGNIDIDTNKQMSRSVEDVSYLEGYISNTPNKSTDAVVPIQKSLPADKVNEIEDVKSGFKRRKFSLAIKCNKKRTLDVNDDNIEEIDTDTSIKPKGRKRMKLDGNEDLDLNNENEQHLCVVEDNTYNVNEKKTDVLKKSNSLVKSLSVDRRSANKANSSLKGQKGRKSVPKLKNCLAIKKSKNKKKKKSKHTNHSIGHEENINYKEDIANIYEHSDKAEKYQSNDPMTTNINDSDIINLHIDSGPSNKTFKKRKRSEEKDETELTSNVVKKRRSVSRSNNDAYNETKPESNKKDYDAHDTTTVSNITQRKLLSSFLENKKLAKRELTSKIVNRCNTDHVENIVTTDIKDTLNECKNCREIDCDHDHQTTISKEIHGKSKYKPKKNRGKNDEHTEKDLENFEVYESSTQDDSNKIIDELNSQNDLNALIVQKTISTATSNKIMVANINYENKHAVILRNPNPASQNENSKICILEDIRIPPVKLTEAKEKNTEEENNETNQLDSETTNSEGFEEDVLTNLPEGIKHDERTSTVDLHSQLGFNEIPLPVEAPQYILSDRSFNEIPLPSIPSDHDNSQNEENTLETSRTEVDRQPSPIMPSLPEGSLLPFDIDSVEIEPENNEVGNNIPAALTVPENANNGVENNIPAALTVPENENNEVENNIPPALTVPENANNGVENNIPAALIEPENESNEVENNIPAALTVPENENNEVENNIPPALTVPENANNEVENNIPAALTVPENENNEVENNIPPALTVPENANNEVENNIPVALTVPENENNEVKNNIPTTLTEPENANNGVENNIPAALIEPENPDMLPDTTPDTIPYTIPYTIPNTTPEFVFNNEPWDNKDFQYQYAHELGLASAMVQHNQCRINSATNFYYHRCNPYNNYYTSRYSEVSSSGQHINSSNYSYGVNNIHNNVSICKLHINNNKKNYSIRNNYDASSHFNNLKSGRSLNLNYILPAPPPPPPLQVRPLPSQLQQPALEPFLQRPPPPLPLLTQRSPQPQAQPTPGPQLQDQQRPQRQHQLQRQLQPQQPAQPTLSPPQARPQIGGNTNNSTLDPRPPQPAPSQNNSSANNYQNMNTQEPDVPKLILIFELNSDPILLIQGYCILTDAFLACAKPVFGILHVTGKLTFADESTSTDIKNMLEDENRKNKNDEGIAQNNECIVQRGHNMGNKEESPLANIDIMTVLNDMQQGHQLLSSDVKIKLYELNTGETLLLHRNSYRDKIILYADVDQQVLEDLVTKLNAIRPIFSTVLSHDFND